MALLFACGPHHFETPDGTRTLVLPADHANHPRFKMEDWYWNGHLVAEDGRRFDFFFSILRRNTRGDRINGVPILLIHPEFYLGVGAITDRAGSRYLTDFRTNLFDPGGAGADDTRPFWFHENGSAQFADGKLDLHFTAKKTQLHLTLTPEKPVALYGEKGFVAGPNDPHYIYSLTRLDAAGVVVEGGRGIPVKGVAWFDHYLGDPHSATFRAWDWLSLQLDDGTELMLAQLHRDDEEQTVPYLALEIGKDGSVRQTTATWKVLRRWVSPKTKREYRLEWQIDAPGLSVHINPVFDGQEFKEAYLWEGAVQVEGTHDGHPVGGEAYLETIAKGGLPRASFESGR